MPEENMLTQALISGAVTVASVFIGGRMAMRTYRSNQWWDARRKTYEAATEILWRLAQFELHVWSWQVDRMKGSVSESDIPEEVAKFESVLGELDKLITQGEFNMSRKAYTVLRDIHHRLQTGMLPVQGKFTSDSPSNILRNGRARFSHASLADLQMLSWLDKIQIFLTWVYPRAFTGAFWLLSCVLVVLVGSKKGRRIADQIGDGFPLLGLSPRTAFNERYY
ncbi:MAG TPA: hypothetical protein PLB55_16125 [Prosthecobacter sp.]|nr:hypothetical protein [Prosthecobacter sp.]